jgi:hypothetical protein
VVAVAVSVAVSVPDKPETRDSSAVEVDPLVPVGDAETWTVGEGEPVGFRNFEPFTGLSHRPDSVGVAAVSVGVAAVSVGVGSAVLELRVGSGVLESVAEGVGVSPPDSVGEGLAVPD